MLTKKQYTVERVGQMDFFDNYRIPYKDDDSVLVDNTDGVYHGNLLEFKLNINNTGKVLFQAIKYLSKMRVKGESVPARIMLINLNATKVYVYNTIHYIDKAFRKALRRCVSINAFNHCKQLIEGLDLESEYKQFLVQKESINS